MNYARKFGALIIFLTCLSGCGNDEAGDALVLADIVPHVRISASDTLHEAFPWPIEAMDGPATIRDLNPDTSWKIPASPDTVLTLDIQPWQGRAVALDKASMSLTGQVTSVSVKLFAWCGGDVVETVSWTDPSAVLDLAGRGAGCIELHFATQSTAALEGLEISAFVSSASVAAPRPPARPDRIEAGLWSGVIEGFYGVPWSWNERKRIVDLLSRTGLGSYIYCPKWDPMHRAEWRTPYTDSQLDDFEDLIAYASERDVRFLFGISPFIDFDFTDDSDYLTLKSKVMDFVARGAPGVTLLADDIEFETGHPIGGEMGAAHVDVVNRMLADLRQVNPDVVVAFCPTVYSDERIESLGENEGDGLAYLAALSGMDPDVQILWTGPHTSDAVMKASDMDRFASITGRKPLIWDNFWANDGGDGFIGRILLGAFSGREPALPAAVAGILHNPSIQGGLMRLTLGTFAAFMLEPAGYDASAAVAVATDLESTSGAAWKSDNDQDRGTAAFVMALFDGNAQKMPGHGEVLARVAALSESIEAGGEGRDDDFMTLLPLLARMAAIESEVHHSGLAADMSDDLYYPLSKIRHEGETGLLLLQAISERNAGRQASDVLGAAGTSIFESNSCRFTFGQGELEDLQEAVEEMTVQGTGSGALVVTVPAVDCAVGKEVTLNPEISAPDSRIWVAGLSGAVVSGEVIKWTPKHAGSYRAVVAAFHDGSPASTGWTAFDVVCGFLQQE